MWHISHKSGTRLFTTKDKFTALNRAQYGWRVTEMKELKVHLCRTSAKMPTYATLGSACFDLYAAIDKPYYCCVGEPVTIPTGLKFDIPEGYALMIYSRSGHGFKSDVRLSNCVGVIDSDYVDEVMVKLSQDVDQFKGDNWEHERFWVNPGDRIAQGMLIPVQRTHFVELCDAPGKKGNRDGGFGSTGN